MSSSLPTPIAQRLLRALPWAGASLLLATSGLFAQGAQDGEDPPPRPQVGGGEEQHEPERAEVPETIVTATRYPQSAFDIPMGVTAVSRREILERGSRTAAEALRNKPGIWVQKTGHLGGSPILRGFMGNRVIYLFDGIRRNTAGLFKGPNSFLQNIDALDIDRIEVVRGPGSVLYGSDAIGGIVNVITNEVPLFSSGPTGGGRLYTRYASVDREFSARTEGYYSDPAIYAFVGTSYRRIEDLRGGRGVGVQAPSRWREKNLDAQIDLRLDADSTLELFAQDFSRPRGRRFDRPNWKQTNDRELVGLEYRTGGRGFLDDLEVSAYFHDQENFIDEKFFDSDSDEETLGGDIQGTTFVGEELRLVYGAHFHHDDIVKSNPQKGTEDPEVQWDNPAVFVLSEWQASESLRLDLGLRWDRFALESKAPALSRLPSEIQSAIGSGSFALSDLELDETDDAVTGGMGAVVQLADGLNLVGHVGRSFRAPNKSDLLSFGQFTFGFNVPSPDLDPESSWTYELGLRMQREDFSGALTAFYTTIDDAIVSAPGTFNGSDFVDANGNGINDPGETVFVKDNSDGTVRARGVELEARQYLPASWVQPLVGDGALSWYGNFSWVIGEDSGANEPLDRAFPANGLLGLRLDGSRNARESRFFVELETWLVRHFGRIPSTRRNSDPAFRENPQDKSSPLIGGNGDLPGFGVVNLRGGFQLSRDAMLFLGVENLTDRKYRVKDSRIDGPGQNLVIGLQVSF